MRVALHMDYATGQIAGVWMEVPGGVRWEYRDEVSAAVLDGIAEMEACPAVMSWPEYWQRLADRISPLFWIEVAEVDDEASLYQVLWHLKTCHPSAPSESVSALVEECNETEADAVGFWLEQVELDAGDRQR